MIRRSAILLLLAGGVVAAPAASGSTEASLPIRIGHGIGPVNLGMTGAQVYRVLGRPRTVVERKVIRGRPYVEFEYQYGAWTVGFYGRKGNRRVVLVVTGLRRHRTPQGLGVGSAGTEVRQKMRGGPAADLQQPECLDQLVRTARRHGDRLPRGRPSDRSDRRRRPHGAGSRLHDVARGALCDDGTRERLRMIGKSFDWASLT
jgi:hypothetical protein